MSAARGAPVPSKLHYRLSEVCELTDTQPYVLRFWEQEFPQLASEKSRSGQRLYRREDMELVRQIKHLLYDREFTIPAARAALDSGDALDFAEEPVDEAGVQTRAASRAGEGRTAEAPRPAAAREISQDLEGLLFDSSTSPSAGGGADDMSALSARLQSAESRAAEAAIRSERLEQEKVELSRALETARAERADLQKRAAGRGPQDDARRAKQDSAAEALRDELVRLREEGERKIAELKGELARLKVEADTRSREATRLRRTLDRTRSEIRIAVGELRRGAPDESVDLG